MGSVSNERVLREFPPLRRGIIGSLTERDKNRRNWRRKDEELIRGISSKLIKNPDKAGRRGTNGGNARVRAVQISTGG